MLMGGAIFIGLCAVFLASGVYKTSKIHIDAAMAVTLTLFFGSGILLMRIIANGTYPGKGGIQDYLFGKVSVLTRQDLYTIVGVGILVFILLSIFFKEFFIRSFDPTYAEVTGFTGWVIDLLMYTCVVLSIVVGVKAVGLVLMVAFVVTPPAAARQWVKTLPSMVMLSGFFGALGSAVGAYLSIQFDDIPTGPVIVLALFVLFVASLVMSPRRNVIVRAVRTWQHTSALRKSVGDYKR